MHMNEISYQVLFRYMPKPRQVNVGALPRVLCTKWRILGASLKTIAQRKPRWSPGQHNFRVIRGESRKRHSTTFPTDALTKWLADPGHSMMTADPALTC